MAKLKPNQFLLNGHLITERPILYSTEMVKANLEDRKTMTRRTKGLTLNNDFPKSEWSYTGYFLGTDRYDKWAGMTQAKNLKTGNLSFVDMCPYGKPADLLYVRENWSRIEARIYFQADEAEDELKEEYSLDKIRWKPSIHLPKSGSRIWAMVEEIQVERVKDISEEDAKAEGIMEFESSNPGLKDKMFGLPSFKVFGINRKVAFKNLWISINGRASWDANPWVWVIKYRILSKTGRPSDEVISYHLKEILPPSHFPLPTP